MTVISGAWLALVFSVNVWTDDSAANREIGKKIDPIFLPSIILPVVLELVFGFRPAAATARRSQPPSTSMTFMKTNDHAQAPPPAAARIETRLMLELRSIMVKHRLVVVVLPRFVCAQHGHSPNGVQVPCMKTKHEPKGE